MSVHLRIRVPEGGREALLAFLDEAVPFYESPGGIRVRLLAHAEAGDRFVEQVDHVDERTYQADEERLRSEATVAGYLDRWRGLLAEPPVVEVYRPATRGRRQA